MKLIHTCQKGQHSGADVFCPVCEEISPRMAEIVVEDDERCLREHRHGLAYRLGRRPLIARQHQELGRQGPEWGGFQARWTDERQGSNRLRMSGGEAMPVGGHTGCHMHLLETQVPEKLHQSPVNRTLRVARHMLTSCSTTVTLLRYPYRMRDRCVPGAIVCLAASQVNSVVPAGPLYARLRLSPATAWTEGFGLPVPLPPDTQLNGRPYPATASAEGAQLNGRPSLLPGRGENGMLRTIRANPTDTMVIM